MNYRFHIPIVAALFFVSVGSIAAQTQVPPLINYQGRIDSSNVGINGTRSITFTIYDALSGGNQLWQETQSVAIANGVFDALMGISRPIPSTVFTGSGDKYLELSVSGVPQPMTSRYRFTSSPYAYRAGRADTVAIADSARRAPGSSQWITSGSDIYYTSGKVGVGTATPASTLDVAGTVKMTGFSLATGASTGKVLTSDASGTGSWQGPVVAPFSDATAIVKNSSDGTKLVQINVGTAATGTMTTIQAGQTANRTISLPDATDQLVGRATVDNLTNKTLTGTTNTVAASQLRTAGSDVVVSGATAPTAGQVLTATSPTAAAWQTVTSGGGPPFSDATALVKNSSDSTKQLQVSVGGATTRTTTTISSSQTANRTITLPDATDQLVGRATVDNLTHKTLTGTTNTVAASQLRTAGSDVVVSGATAPTAGQVLTATSPTAAVWQTVTSGGGPPFSDATALVKNSSDSTKQLQVSVGGATTRTTTTISSSQTANRTITLPDATDQLVGRATVDNLTNKTLTSPVISTITNTGTLTLPTSTDVLVGRTTADLLQNKNHQNNNNFFVDGTDISKRMGFLSSGASTGTTMTLSSSQTANRTISLPDATDQLVGRATVDNLTNKTLTGTTNTVAASQLRTAGSDVVVSGATAPTAGQVLTATSPTAAAWQTVTSGGGPPFSDATALVKNSSDSTKQLQVSVGGATTRTTTTISSSQTANRTITLPDATDQLVGRATVDNLTHKTLTGTTNTVAASQLRTAGSDVVVSGATAPTAGQVLTATSPTAAVWQTVTSGGGPPFSDATALVKNSSDSTKQLQVSVGGATTRTTTTISSSQTANRTITLPDATDQLVGRATVDNLTNKTLTSPVISTITNTGTLTLPTSTDVLVGRTTADLLQNKNHQNNNNFFVDGTDISKRMGFLSSGASTGTTMTLSSSQTANRTISLPDATDQLVGRATVDNLTNKTLTGTTNTVAASQLRTAGSDVVVSGATAPTAGQVLTATSPTAAAWQTPTSSLWRTLGSDIYYNAGKVGIGMSTAPSQALDVNGNINIPSTTTTAGIIYQGGSPFVHSFGTGNFFAATSAGNLTMTGGNNTAVGYSALNSNVAGSGNTSVGYRSLFTNTNGTYNTAIGYNADVSANNLTNATAIGYRATVGQSNSLVLGGTGSFAVNVGIGTTTPGQALDVNGNINIPATTITSGIIYQGGSPVLHSFGTSNFFAGVGAGNLTLTGISNTALGASALPVDNAGNYNVAIGASALIHNTAGSDNCANGYRVLYYNVNGNDNTASGYVALSQNLIGSSNTASGAHALNWNSSGNQNSAFGDSALYTNSSGSNNTAIGYNADVSAGNLTNATAIGNGAVVNASNKIRLGNTSVTVIEGQVAYTFTSDSTKKENHRSIDGEEALRKIRQMRVGSWNFKGQDPTKYRHYGPMAQEFFSLFGHDDVGRFGTDTTINSGDIDGINLIAVKALEKRTAEQQQTIEELKVELKLATEKIEHLQTVLYEKIGKKGNAVNVSMQDTK